MSFDSPRKYYDDQNFPHGFHRSGDFTRAQAEVLENKGHVLKALHEGLQDPTDDMEKQFVTMCQGKREASTLIEKAWQGYLNALSHKQVYFTASPAAMNSESEDEGDESDDD